MGIFFIYTLKAAICLVVFYLFYKLLLSNETFHRFNRIALLGIIMLSMLIPKIEFTTDTSTAINQVLVTIEKLTTTETTASDTAFDESPTITMSQIALIIYVLGGLFVVMHISISIIKLLRIIKQGTHIKYKDGITLIIIPNISIHKEQNCNNSDYTSKLSNSNHVQDIAPFSWFHYLIISENDYQNNPCEILEHEMAHISRYHSFDLALCSLLVIIQWFNPAAWLLKRELESVHEYEADEAVLNKGVDAKHYQMLLIRKSVGDRLFSIANNLNKNCLKKRIKMMNSKRSNPWLQLKYLYVIPIAMIAVVAYANPKISIMSNTIKAESDNIISGVIKPIEHDASNDKQDENNFLKKDKNKSLENNKRNTSAQSKSRIELHAITVTGDLNDSVTREKQAQIDNTMDKKIIKFKFKKRTGMKLYSVDEAMPQYEENLKNCYKYIASHIKYPSTSYLQHEEGCVIIQFVVDKSGKVCKPMVALSAGKALDNEALRIVRALPEWVPGSINGKNVSVEVALPFKFKLNKTIIEKGDSIK